jgi:phosphoserine aminotransferase
MQVTFNPGPSRLYPRLKAYLAEAYDSGMLSMSHRSQAFSDMYAELAQNLKQQLNVPEEYRLYLFSSATECWSVLADGATTASSVHLYSGAFGERWYDYTQRIQPEVKPLKIDTEYDLNQLDLAEFEGYELVCLTQNETSNASQVSPEHIQRIRQATPKALLAVDATSSLAGLDLPIAQADIWFASVQKAFGLPAGLSVMFASPRAVEHFHRVNYRGRYHSLVFVEERYQKWQNTHTPNVMGIYLLWRLSQELPPIAEIDRKVRDRAAKYYEAIEQKHSMRPLIQRTENRSATVIAVRGEPALIQQVKDAALQQGITLGSGYGTLKKETFRIANFPALQDEEVDYLFAFLDRYE